MNRRGEWIVPYYNGHPWFEKPILTYWFVKPSLMLFGDTWGPRLPSVLATLGTLGVVAWFCRRRLSDDAAKLAVLILSGSLLFVAVGRMLLTDPFLVLSLTTAFTTFYESLVGDRRWRLVTAAALGFSVLAKGPVGLLMFAVLAGWTYWREPGLRPAFRGHWALGTLILASVVSLWYVPVYLNMKESFVEEFLIRQNIGRFSGGDLAHNFGGVFFFVPVLLLGMLPWSLWLFKAWPRRGEPVQRYLASWAVIVFVLFSVSGSKLVHYILPAVPPLAMLVAPPILERLAWRRVALALPVVMFLLVNIGFWTWYHGLLAGSANQAEAHDLARQARSLSGGVAIYQMSRRDKALGTGELKVQETSLPSLLMYMDRVALQTDEMNDILELQTPVTIITRWNRIGETELEMARARNHRLVPLHEGKPGGYSMYRLEGE